MAGHTVISMTGHTVLLPESAGVVAGVLLANIVVMNIFMASRLSFIVHQARLRPKTVASYQKPLKLQRHGVLPGSHGEHTQAASPTYLHVLEDAGGCFALPCLAPGLGHCISISAIFRWWRANLV